jgi:cation diffusion facilitator CzcD-associated flavoprotein CzcO
MDRAITGLEKRLFKLFPPLMKLVRGWIYTANEALVVGLVYRPRLMKLIERFARLHLRRQVPDRELRRKLTPRYRIGCKRILRADDYYPALAKPNVDVITDGIAEIRAHSIVTTDGVERPVDTIIYGTGFHVTDQPLLDRVRGRDGVLLADANPGTMKAHNGTTFAGFPNMFTLVGPNTGLGHNSIVYMIESQLNYVVDALRTMRREGAHSVEVDAAAQARYNAGVQRAMEGTVWTVGGCASWYLDGQGRNTTLWPGFTFRFRALTKQFDREHYALRRAPVREQVAA